MSPPANPNPPARAPRETVDVSSLPVETGTVDRFDEIRGFHNPKTGWDLRGVDHQRLASGPVQWPAPPGAGERNPIRYRNDGISQTLFIDEDGTVPELAFATPSRRARFLARPYLPESEAPDADYPMLLTTGRLAHQWHTMTKTGKVKKLNKLNPSSFVEIHPDDAELLGVADGDHVRVTSRRGEVLLPATVTDAILPGLCFVPMHWGDAFGTLLAVNAVTNDLVDPESLQPEFKLCAVSLCKAEPPITTPNESEPMRQTDQPRADQIPAPAGLDALASLMSGMNAAGGGAGAGAAAGAKDKQKKPRDPNASNNGANMATVLGVMELCWGDVGLMLSIPGQGLGNAAIAAVANEEQLARFGDKWAAMAITEPEAGSDSAAIRTTARLDGDEWVINGEKIFVTAGERADCVVVWATLDRNLGRAAIKSFVVEKGTPGMELIRLDHKMGIRASDTAVLSFNDCRIPKTNILGSPEIDTKKSFAGVMQTFDNTRPMVAAMAVGVGKAVHVADALFERARRDPSITLTIFTALTLEIPRPRGDLERRFLEPLVSRLYGACPDPVYARAVRENRLPENIRVVEFYLRPGGYLDNATAQQSYTSLNYTHVARELLQRGVNVVAPGVPSAVIVPLAHRART